MLMDRIYIAFEKALRVSMEEARAVEESTSKTSEDTPSDSKPEEPKVEAPETPASTGNSSNKGGGEGWGGAMLCHICTC
jgi:hypothetical protein